MRYSEDIIEEVRSKNDIVDVIGKNVKLQRKGANYFGVCPFHSERTGSFSVSQSKQIYHCFGCGVGGDVISFMMKHEKISFPEALKQLAERAGIQFPEEGDSPRAKEIIEKKRELLGINREAVWYYTKNLQRKNGVAGLNYLLSRGLSNETMNRFGLGYASSGYNKLANFLKNKGYSDAQIINAGLATFDETKGLHDKFWNRVIFPIYDSDGKVIGFGGRVLGEGKPKYLNSPETIIFDKSRNLFGLNYAKHSNAGYMILCEGYMDVISMHQAGLDMAVASLGTAFTSGQAQLLKRYTDTVILSYDSDDAGIRATLRGIKVLKSVGLKSKVLDLWPYKDPDEFLKHQGKDALMERVKQSENSFLFEIRVLEASYDMNDPASKTDFYKKLAEMLNEFEEPLERRNYLEAVAARYNIDPNEMYSLMVSVALEKSAWVQ